MAVKIVDAPIQELYGQQVAPQTSANLTTSRRSLNVRQGFTEILIEPELEIRMALCPKIVGVYHYDDSEDRWNDLLVNDASILDSSRTGTSAFTLAVADFLYIGALQRFGGARFDLSSVVNAQAGTTTAEYFQRGIGFTSVTIVDGTDTGAAFAQDGNITIAVADMPTAAQWDSVDLAKATGLASAPKDSVAHWLRLDTSVLMDLVEIQDLAVLHHDMAAVLATGGGGGIFREDTEYTIDLHDNVGAIEFISIAASATTMNLTWIRR